MQPDLESVIPILPGHDLSARPIGIVKFENGVIKFKLNDKAQITAEQIQNVNKAFSPTYLVTKEENGFVEELELIAMNVLDTEPVKGKND